MIDVILKLKKLISLEGAFLRMSEEEKESCYGNWRCSQCGNSGTYHYGSQKDVICTWNQFSKEFGCGRVVIKMRQLSAPHCNARNAALCFVWCVRFGAGNNSLNRLKKDLAVQIAKLVWASRSDEKSWMMGFGDNGVYETPKKHFRKASGSFVPCGKCKAPVYVWDNTRRWPFGHVACSACGAIIRTLRSDDNRRFVQPHLVPQDEEIEVFLDDIPSDAE